jgi:hypothetical protein
MSYDNIGYSSAVLCRLSHFGNDNLASFCHFSRGSDDVNF